MGDRTWLIAGSLAEQAERILLFRAPIAVSWARFKGLPRSAVGTTFTSDVARFCVDSKPDPGFATGNELFLPSAGGDDAFKNREDSQ